VPEIDEAVPHAETDGRSSIANATSEIVEFVVAATEIDIAGDRAGIVDDIVGGSR
jgi:hypothetical protein